jgi:hypothetical protein
VDAIEGEGRRGEGSRGESRVDAIEGEGRRGEGSRGESRMDTIEGNEDTSALSMVARKLLDIRSISLTCRALGSYAEHWLVMLCAVMVQAGCKKSASRVQAGCKQGASRVQAGCKKSAVERYDGYKQVIRVLQYCYKAVTECYKGESNVPWVPGCLVSLC